jgi:hypothetical protein
MSLIDNIHLQASESLGKYTSGFFSKKLKHPIFIIGSGRSGTSLLGRLLRDLADVNKYPNEANHIWHPYLYPYHKTKSIETPPIWINPQRFTQDSLDSWDKNWDEKIRGIFGAHQFFSGKEVFINKTVMINFMLPKVYQIFPEAKFIHIHRNGLSVVSSYQKKELEKFQSHKIYRKYGNYFESPSQLRKQFAIYWNMTISEISKFKSDYGTVENFIEISYEDLMRKPESTIESLSKFMGVRNTLKELDIRKEYSIESKNYKSRSLLTQDEIDDLNNILKSTH